MDLNIKNTPKRIKKKDAILDSALTIFSIYGYNNTKLEQITESLSLTDKSIYYYFSSKGDLFIEVIRLVQNKLDVDRNYQKWATEYKRTSEFSEGVDDFEIGGED